MQEVDIQKYVDLARRRKYWIIIPALLSLLGGIIFSQKAPKIYEGETLILVQPQRVPEGYVRSIVEGTVEARLRTISQQVTSRTNLEKIIQEYKFSEEHKNSADRDEVIKAVRERIRIDVTRGKGVSTFTIAFQSGEPETAMKVTNALATNFIEENLKLREEHAEGTSSFLSDELTSLEKRLLSKEQELKEYREQHMGGLPEQLQTNLKILERLETQVETLSNSSGNAENRKILIQTQLAERSNAANQTSVARPEVRSEVRTLQSMRNELASMKARYTSEHPDVRRLEGEIASLERGESAVSAQPELGRRPSAVSGIEATLKKQLRETEFEISNLKGEIKNTRSQIGWYRKMVEDTPKREQEIVSMNRDYKNLKDNYSSLLNRKFEADVAVSMEKKQKGEQFRVIDPAIMPTKPIKPNKTRILLLALVLGLGIGGSLVYFAEAMDTSYKSPEEVEQDLKLPVLMSLPVQYSAREIRRQKFREVLKACGIFAGFGVSAVGVTMATEGVDKTLGYIRKFLDRI